MTTKSLPSEAAWLLERKTHITGTDAAKILGLSKYGDAFTVWLDKTGQAQPTEPSRRMVAGLRYQKAILDDYALETGHSVRHADPYEILVHGGGLLAASLDAYDETLGDCPVDAKNVAYAGASDGWGEAGTDEIPMDYKCQLAVQMAVTGAPLARLAVLVGGWDLRIYQVDRDLALEDKILKAARDFWDRYILGGEQPEPGATKQAADYLSDKYATADAGTFMTALPDDEPWADYLRQAIKDKEDAERREEEAKNWLKARMGHKEAMFGANWKATWKYIQGGKKIDYEAAFRDSVPLAAQETLLARHTTTKDGYRRFTFK